MPPDPVSAAVAVAPIIGGVADAVLTAIREVMAEAEKARAHGEEITGAELLRRSHERMAAAAADRGLPAEVRDAPR